MATRMRAPSHRPRRSWVKNAWAFMRVSTSPATADAINTVAIRVNTGPPMVTTSHPTGFGPAANMV